MQNNFLKFKKIPIAFSLALLALSFFVFFFLYKEINSNQKILQEGEVKWQNEAYRRDGVKNLESLIKEMGQEIVLLESHFAQSSDIVPFFNTIERLASLSQIKTEVFSVDVSKDNKEILIGLKTSGTFEEIYKFLMLLENAPYELEFVSMDIKNLNKQEWEAFFKIKLLSFI